MENRNQGLPGIDGFGVKPAIEIVIDRRPRLRPVDRSQMILYPTGIDMIIPQDHEARDKHLKPIVITALNTGMRKGEILGLKRSNLDSTNGFILLDGQRMVNGARSL